MSRQDLNEAARQSAAIKTQLIRMESTLAKMEARVTWQDARAEATNAVPFGTGHWSGAIRLLIWVIVAAQLTIGGYIAWRLGPNGYTRVQAKANFEHVCKEIQVYHPKFICPPIAEER